MARPCLRSLGEWCALQGRWRLAADRFSQLLQVNQLDGPEVATRDFFKCAVVLATVGKPAKFDLFRRKLTSHFAREINPPAAERLLEASLLLPPDEHALLALQSFAQMVIPNATVSIGNPRSGSAAKTLLQNLKLQNIGTDQPCSLTNENDVITLTAGGADIWGEADEFAYASTKVAGDFDCRLRVRSMVPALNGYTRVGLMARESSDQPGSRQVMVADDATNAFQILMRLNADAWTISVPEIPLPTAYGSNSWLRLQRSGAIFHAYASSNGVDWVHLYQTTGGARTFADPIYVGIAASAHSSNQLATFKVSDFGPTPTMTVNLAVTLALLDYRRGDFPAAADACNRVLAYPECDPVHDCTARVILAMADEQLHQPDEARTQLSAVRNVSGQKFAEELEAGNAKEGYWFEWVFVRVLLQEAVALIEVPKLPADSQN
jgi:hypothetical protein